jgi:hypothetical protein
MGRFLRSKRLRNALYLSADGLCAKCGVPLGPDWHADHIVPWCVSGDTNVHEMQALCPECNLKKGATVADRKHQSELREHVSLVDSSDLPLCILAWVVPAGGKSRLPGILAERFPNHLIGWFVPRLTLQSQAVEDMKKNFNIVLRDAGNDPDPSRGTRGFVATHQALMDNPDLWRDEFRRRPYVLVVDELHHAKIERNGTRRPLSSALERLQADVSLYMTGTLETNDNTFIHGAHYDPVEGGRVINPRASADIYIRYDRVTALRERAIVPIEFQHHDGPVKWKLGTADEKEKRLSEVNRDDEGAALYTALRTDIAAQLYASGLEKPEWGETQKELIYLTGKSIKEMNIEELKRAHTELQSLRSR